MTVPDPGRTSSIYWIGAGVTATMLVIVAAAGVWLWTDRVRTIEAGERSVSALVRVLEEQTARSFEAVDLTLLGMIDAMRLNPSLPAHDARFENRCGSGCGCCPTSVPSTSSARMGSSNRTQTIRRRPT